MSGGGNATDDCVSLAIAFHQAPGRFSDLLHGRAELPKGIGKLLRLAGGAEAEGVNGQAFVPAAEIRQAARFFIEQVLLAHEADHYRVLGVRPDASLEEIKEHHRLLMRVFHPDREGAAEDGWSEDFATRINLAYTALRQPQARAAYDAARRQAQTQQTQKQQKPRPSAPWRRPEAQEGAGFRLPPAVARNLPQLVLGGFALLASLAVGVVYLTRPPAGAIGAGDDYGQGLPREAAAPSRHENAALERLREAVAEAPAQAAPAQEENKAAQESTRLEATPRTADAPAAGAARCRRG